MNAPRGPVCGSELGDGWIDIGTLSRTQAPTRAPAGGSIASQAERELLLDLGQMVLDLSGILDPTPVSDGSNVLISLSRGDWTGAGISSISLIPYVGDLAKAGKLGRWCRTVHTCIDLARHNARFAERARPLLRQLARLLDQVPVRLAPDAARVQLVRLKEALSYVLGVSTRLSRRSVLDAYLKEWRSYISRIHLRPQDSGNGVLWSRLPGSSEDAQRLAKLDDKQTLEMMLSDFDFQKRFNLAVEQLHELLGDSQMVKEEIWAHFGRPIWEQLSKKYAMTLRGDVKAYVRFSGPKGLHSVRGPYTPGNLARDPLIFDEIDVISDAMLFNPAITSVRLVDSSSGAAALMTREEVLRMSRRTQ